MDRPHLLRRSHRATRRVPPGSSRTGTVRRVGRARRLPQSTCALAAAAIAGNAVRLRARVRRLAVLDGDDARPGPAPAADVQPATDRDFATVTAAGVVIDDATMATAVRHAEAHDLDVVDLVPGDLPVTRLLELATQVDTARYRTQRAGDRVGRRARGGGAALGPRPHRPRRAVRVAWRGATSTPSPTCAWPDT